MQHRTSSRSPLPSLISLGLLQLSGHLKPVVWRFLGRSYLGATNMTTMLPEFREEAIRLMRSSEKPLAQISRELCVSEQFLRNWREQAEIDSGEREGLTTEER